MKKPPNKPQNQARENQHISAVTFCGLAADVDRRLTPDMKISIRRPRSNRRIIPECRTLFGGFHSAAWPPFETADHVPPVQNVVSNLISDGPYKYLSFLFNDLSPTYHT